MEIFNALDKAPVKIETYPYKGKPYKVKEVWIRWLSQAGPKDSPEYGLRFFTIGPAGEIPIHNHFYHQTMYILDGEFECWEFDPETDELITKAICGPGTSIYIPSMEPHGMKNVCDRDSTFLCCICNVYKSEEIV